MSNILVNTIKDTGNNTLLSSDGSGSVTLVQGSLLILLLFAIKIQIKIYR
jgi:hypothetical protein